MQSLLVRLGICGVLIVVACHGGPATRNSVPVETLPVGYVLTSPEGYRMTARIDGLPWEASRMLAFDNGGAAVRVEGISPGGTIAFNLWLHHLRTGSRVYFYAGVPAELVLPGSAAVWNGTSGTVDVLRVDENRLEGTFRFTAVLDGTARMITVTEGYFRIMLAAQAPAGG